jgi:hypothetical protein
MSEFERQLYLRDLKKINEEYFECEDAALEITRTEEGFLVCVIFNASRIKTLKRPV